MTTTTRGGGAREWARALATCGVAATVCATTMMMTPMSARALGLNKSGNSDAYAEMMRQMEAERARDAGDAPAMSAESLFKQGGGACGDGYELRVVKVLGASCVCVSDSCANDASRQERSEYERSFGKQEESKDAEAGAGEASGGIKFTFATD